MAVIGPDLPGKVCWGKVPGILSFPPATHRHIRTGTNQHKQWPFMTLSLLCQLTEKLKVPKVGETSLLEVAWRLKAQPCHRAEVQSSFGESVTAVEAAQS